MTEAGSAPDQALVTPQWPSAWRLSNKIGVVCTTVRALGSDQPSLENGGSVEDYLPYGGFNLGDHVGDDPERVFDNRRLLQECLGLSALQWLQQVHGTDVCVATHASAKASVQSAPSADAAWTTETSVGLAVMTADCLPLVLCDPAGGRLAIAHGGWRGLVAGVLEATLDAAGATVDQNWVAWIGPGICAHHYEVGAEVADQVRACLTPSCKDAALGLTTLPSPGKYHLDLAKLAQTRLERWGLSRILKSNLCSYGDGRFYSYRQAHGAGRHSTGRMATIVWRRR